VNPVPIIPCLVLLLISGRLFHFTCCLPPGPHFLVLSFIPLDIVNFLLSTAFSFFLKMVASYFSSLLLIPRFCVSICSSFIFFGPPWISSASGTLRSCHCPCYFFKGAQTPPHLPSGYGLRAPAVTAPNSRPPLPPQLPPCLWVFFFPRWMALTFLSPSLLLPPQSSPPVSSFNTLVLLERSPGTSRISLWPFFRKQFSFDFGPSMWFRLGAAILKSEGLFFPCYALGLLDFSSLPPPPELLVVPGKDGWSPSFARDPCSVVPFLVSILFVCSMDSSIR